ncbi:unnamed protein product [Prunus armeniaca]
METYHTKEDVSYEGNVSYMKPQEYDLILGTEDSLAEWLEAGEQPVHIGFDSLPLEEPENMTNIILQALEITGQRGVINRGWGGLGNCASWGCWDNCCWSESYVSNHNCTILWGPAILGAEGACHRSRSCTDEFSLEKLVKERAVEIAKAMDGKYGVTGAVNTFHRHFPHNKSEDKPESLPARRGLFSIRRCFGYSSYT